MKMNKKADIIVDLQFGSTGKGAIAGYMAVNGNYDTVISANRPNAGHTFIDERGNKMVHKVLPNAVVGPNVQRVLIGPGAVFSLAQLFKELDALEQFGYLNFEVFIHEAAVILQDKHKEAEQHYSRIGSTRQGAAAAIFEKMDRDPLMDPTAKHTHIPHRHVMVVRPHSYHELLVRSKEILLEGAQGYSLGIDAGFWPYCTSRNCTVNSFLNDMAIPHHMLRHVIGTARTYPIRVAGTSGPCYPDQHEITWGSIGQKEEYTTVTQKVRRVFTFSFDQIIEACNANQPDFIFLNFVNYMDPKQWKHLAEQIETATGVKIKYYGHGATVNDIVEVDCA